MANLIRWDPFREMSTMRSMMEHMWDDNFFGPRGDWLKSMNWELPLDVVETENEFLVKASLPGINPDDLDITYSNGAISIKGEMKEEKDVKEQQFHLRERRFGSFFRTVSLPSTVKADAIDAKYVSGVLTLRLPKSEEAKPKRISVQSSNPIKMIEGKLKNKK
jgi:HSP20 family protein